MYGKLLRLRLSKIVKCAERLGCVKVKYLEELYEDDVHAKTKSGVMIINNYTTAFDYFLRASG